MQFKVLYTIPTTKRDYGVISLPGGLTLPDAAVAEGWVKLRDDADRKNDSDASQAIVQKLEVLEARAKADSKGIWSEATSRLETSYDLPDPKNFLDSNKGKKLDGKLGLYGFSNGEADLQQLLSKRFSAATVSLHAFCYRQRSMCRPWSSSPVSARLLPSE